MTNSQRRVDGDSPTRQDMGDVVNLAL